MMNMEKTLVALEDVVKLATVKQLNGVALVTYAFQHVTGAPMRVSSSQPDMLSSHQGI